MGWLFTHFRSTNQYTNNHNCTHTISFSNAASPFRTFCSASSALFVLYTSRSYSMSLPLGHWSYVHRVHVQRQRIFALTHSRPIQTAARQYAAKSAKELSFVEPLEFIKSQQTRVARPQMAVGQMQINFHGFHRAMRPTNPRLVAVGPDLFTLCCRCTFVESTRHVRISKHGIVENPNKKVPSFERRSSMPLV